MVCCGFFGENMKAWLQIGLIGCLGLLITFFNVVEPLERTLLGARFSADQRPASGTLTVVQIDARSIRELGVWPFSRASHAQAIDQLRKAGAASIAFDVELARSTDEADNQELVDALKRAGGQVVLPSFIQLASAGQSTNDTIRTEPAGIFRDHAWLANVNVYPSPDGRIWTMTYGGWVDGKFQYSLAATLAGRAKRDTREFYIDYGIDITTIPRLSFIDLINGNFDTSLVEGKQIIVGGTAVELGDQLNLPTIGVVSGPVLQALAFETIYQSREIWRTTALVSFALIIFTLFVLAFLRKNTRLTYFLVGVSVYCLLLQAFALWLQHYAAISMDTASVLVIAIVVAIAFTKSELEARREQVNLERTEKENRSKVFDRVIEDSFDGIIILGNDKRLEMINAAGKKILEVRDGENLLGHSLSDVFSDWRLHGEFEVDTGIFDQLGALQELQFRSPSGALKIVEFVAAQSDLENSDGKIQRKIYTLTFRDITQRRNAEQERDNALQEAISANSAKTQFLANMSHELRTPLNAIIGFSEIMRQQLFGKLGSDQYVGYAGDIEASGRHLLSIVNDILDVSRIETGEFELIEEEIDISEIFNSVHRLSDGWPAAAERNISLIVDNELPLLWADARLAKQMVLNLLSNAVKFSNAGSKITISGSLNALGGIQLRVQDEGIGIAADCLPNLTDAFYQVDATLEREFEGSGLGLTLVRKHMDLHGGELLFESKLGVGTTATLSFPSSRTCNTQSEPQTA
jgi:signal transduction histidine kinase